VQAVFVGLQPVEGLLGPRAGCLRRLSSQAVRGLLGPRAGCFRRLFSQAVFAGC